MKLTKEMEVIRFLHGKNSTRRRQVYRQIGGPSQTVGRIINSLIAGGFIKQIEGFTCPHCEKIITTVKAQGGQRSVTLTKSGAAMAEALVSMEVKR